MAANVARPAAWALQVIGLNIIMESDLRRWMRLVEIELPDSIYPKAARRLIQNIDWSGGGGETVMYYLGYNEESPPPNINSRAFKKKLNAWAIERVKDAFEEIDWRFKGDVIRVYRMITAPPTWVPDPNRHPGEYWSWDEHAAQAHWGSFGSGDVKWLMVADVHKSQIDWEQTLAASGSPDAEDEKEITVRLNSPIKLLSYKRVT
jgi:hypothetical protein